MARASRTAAAARPSFLAAPTDARTEFLLEPVDAWFFRDARPFDAEDPAQISMPSLFPPMPQTAIGAVRAALATALGWDGDSDWSGNAAISNVAGSDGRLGPMTGAVMSLVRITEEVSPASRPHAPRQRKITPLFAAPAVLFGELSDDEDALPKRIVRLGVGRSRRCDLGKAVSLPAFQKEGDRRCKPLAGKYWLTAEGMAAFLPGGTPPSTPTHIVSVSDIVKSEPRTGLAIDHAKRTAEPGMLYRVSYARPRSRVASTIAIALNTSRIRRDATADFPRPAPFGGEGRMAWVSARDAGSPALPAAPGNLARDAKTRMVRYTVTLTTPADLGEEWSLTGLPGLPGKIVSACIDKPIPVSGWRRRGDVQEALRSRVLIPAGATWFMEVPVGDQQAIQLIRRAHGGAIGEQTEWGYGRILIGTWNEQGG